MNHGDVCAGSVGFLSSVLSFIKRPVVIILIVGLAIRLILIPIFTIGYDSNFWALIVRNIESGNGLYEIEGYYYTPVWGYILGAWSAFQEAFLNIDVMGTRLLEALAVESYSDWYFSFTASLTSVAFNFWVKFPFVLCDMVVGYLVYWVIKDRTKDEKKATLGFALWFLCPLVIIVTSVSGMFDTFSALFALLCIILVYKDKYFLGGALFVFAVLTKFFPAYLFFILIAYILAKHRLDGRALRSLSYAACGAILAFLILMLPQIMDGTVIESFSFITNRTGGWSEDVSILELIISKSATIFYLVMIPASVFVAVKLYRSDDLGLDGRFFEYSSILIAALFLYPAVSQYLMLFIPFLAYLVVTSDRRYTISWILLSIGTMLLIFALNFTLLLSFGVFTDFISVEFILSMIGQFQEPLLGGLSAMDIMSYTGGVVQYIGMFSVFWIYLGISSKLRACGSYVRGVIGKRPGSEG